MITVQIVAETSRPLRPFHLAAPIRDKKQTRAFYEGLLGCRTAREDTLWIDFDFFGHQLSLHVKPEAFKDIPTNAVDGKSVPVRHFGVILSPEDWSALAEKLKAADTEFIIEPHTRFKGEVGEQSTMFFSDPDGNALEFKAFGDDSQIFAQ